MKVLSITTATDHLSVALTDGEQIIAEKNELGMHNHAERLDPLIDELLKQNQLTLQEIDRFAVAQGPGSYTGLRISITTAKMFASILNKPLVGVSTLKALAQGVTSNREILISELDARNLNFFAGVYLKEDGQLKQLLADGHYNLSKLLDKVAKLELDYPIVFVGSDIANYKSEIEAFFSPSQYRQAAAEENILHATNIGKLAVDEIAQDTDLFLPRYLRRTQAEMDWHRKTGKDFASDSEYVEEV